MQAFNNCSSNVQLLFAVNKKKQLVTPMLFNNDTNSAWDWCISGHYTFSQWLRIYLVGFLEPCGVE